MDVAPNWWPKTQHDIGRVKNLLNAKIAPSRANLKVQARLSESSPDSSAVVYIPIGKNGPQVWILTVHVNRVNPFGGTHHIWVIVRDQNEPLFYGTTNKEFERLAEECWVIMEKANEEYQLKHPPEK